MCLYQGEMFINTIKIIADSLDPTALSQAEISARREAHQIFQFLRQHVPGFENAHLSFTPIKIGIRESRRIIGDYSLNKEDILLGKKYQDTIAWCGYPIDVHKQDRIDSYFQYVENQGEYGIPFRCLLLANWQIFWLRSFPIGNHEPWPPSVMAPVWHRSSTECSA